MSAVRWCGFGLVWIALVLFTVESVTHHRRSLQLAAESVAV
jgi:chloramphenicol-sensitive protein RarD